MAENASWLGKVGQALKWLVAPAASGVRKLSVVGKLFFRVLHILIVLAVLVGLYLLGRYVFRLSESIHLPRQVAEAYLAILALIAYTAGWVVYWIWGLTEPLDDAEHSDISEAWEEAARALERAGFDLTDLPLFLVLGEPADGENAFFQGSRFRPLIPPVPARSDAPVRLHAVKDSTDRPGLFLTCTGASLLGRHSRVLAGKLFDDTPGLQPAAPSVDRTMAPGVTIGPGAESQKVVQSILNQTRNRSLTGEELGDLERVLGPAAPAGQSVLRDPKLVRYHTGRLRHLCRLIARDRSPRCPANGLLLLLPLRGAGDSKGPANAAQTALDTGVICRADLSAVCDVFHMHVPTIGLLCDLEKLDGQREFLSRFTTDERQLQGRIGQRVPFIPRFLTAGTGAARSERMRATLDSLATRVCGPKILEWVYHKKGFQIEGPTGDPELRTVEKHNGRLFQFFDEVHSRRDGLAVMLKEALVGGEEARESPPLPIMFGGLYVAWTGYRPQEQGFYAAVLERLFDSQDAVRWTDEVLNEEEWHRRLTGRAYAALVLIIAACVALLAFEIYKFFDPKKRIGASADAPPSRPRVARIADGRSIS